MADMADGSHDWSAFQSTRQEHTQTPAPSAEMRGTVSRLSNIVGGLVSLGLVIGVGIWGYNLLARDVSGVPIVRAVEGPMRVQPSDPGGLAADHQGLAVNAIAALGTAEAPADTLILAPAPLDLNEGDTPLGALARATPDPDRWDNVTDPAGLLLDELIAGDDAGAEPETLQNASLGSGAALPPGLGRSLRPPSRPKELSLARVAAPVRGPGAVQEIDPASLPAGTRLAQLGAFDSAEIARAEWDRMYGRFGDYMAGKNRVIERASRGGRDFYRLRVMGFADLGEVRRFCSSLLAERAECIPASSR